ncbi:MAG: hypothetical protein OEV94_10750 [Deltaproteobacteria bacterium]|nr:hypothetical protein [Deltaproteobacteria bacterium]
MAASPTDQAERILAGKNKETIQRLMQGVMPVLQETWGNPGRFQEKAVEALDKAAPSLLSEMEAVTLSGPLAQSVYHLLDVHFRAASSTPELNALQVKLGASMVSPFRQGCLWLAVKLRQAQLVYLSGEGKGALTRLAAGLQKNLDNLPPELRGLEPTTLARLESKLADVTLQILGQALGRFSAATLAGRLLEMARGQARIAPAAGAAEATAPSGYGALLARLGDAVVKAETAQAQFRFSHLDENGRKTLANKMRQAMGQQLPPLLALAPEGFETFCRGVEAVVFPYPEQVEFIRGFLKTLYTTAKQAAWFNDCPTQASIVQQYRKLAETKTINPLTLALARTFATHSLAGGGLTQASLDVFSLDLVGEFHWPRTVEDLLAQSA